MRLSQQMLAALLYAGPTGLVAGATAAWWYGLRHVPNPRVIQVDVAAPAKSRLVRWAEFRRTTVPDGRPRTAGPLRFVSAIREAAIGVWSVPELRLARLVDRSPVLPPMWCNPELIDAATEQSLISPDGWFDDVAMAVMVHSRQYHDGPSFEAPRRTHQGLAPGRRRPAAHRLVTPGVTTPGLTTPDLTTTRSGAPMTSPMKSPALSS